MNHYIVHRNRILEPWAHSREVYGPVLTIYRGLAFTWQNAYAHVLIDSADVRYVCRRGLHMPSDGTLQTTQVNKKAWSRYVAEQSTLILTHFVDGPDAFSVDRVPWAIHKIDDRTAREAAVKAVAAEGGRHPVNFDKLLTQIGRDRYW